MIHKPDRVPDLERKDLKVILALIAIVPEDDDIKALKRKMDDSMSFYRWQDSLIKQAKNNFESDDIS